MHEVNLRMGFMFRKQAVCPILPRIAFFLPIGPAAIDVMGSCDGKLPSFSVLAVLFERRRIRSARDRRVKPNG